jgi:hypothetical protein
MYARRDRLPDRVFTAGFTGGDISTLPPTATILNRGSDSRKGDNVIMDRVTELAFAIADVSSFSIIKSTTAVSERIGVSVWYDLGDVDEVSIEAVVEARECLTLRGKLEFGTSTRSIRNRICLWCRSQLTRPRLWPRLRIPIPAAFHSVNRYAPVATSTSSASWCSAPRP